ncbi:unnamed protein product [Rhizoctonia solani]|uniref:Transmembrane protein n=1 Tax=Rhizoctonia solani TaxID=456999 RepID=A0A8H3DMB9_9AGAM|nr:unnamed protein product [Rhizoctonia solani]
MTSWNLPPWDQETFSFGWNPYVNTMQQCSTVKILFDTDLGSPKFHANPPPAPPYTVIVYTGGYQPLTLAVGNIGQNGTYSWVVNLPLGPMYMLAMKDSAGYTGGVSLRWSMTAGTGCTLNPSPLSPAALSITRNGNSQCGNVNYVVSNGTSPFQVEIIPEVRQQKTLHFETNQFGFVLDLPAGLSFFVAITDANGNAAVDGILTVGTSNDNTCLNAAATVSVGMATSMYTGSGIILPATASSIIGLPSTTNQDPSATGSHINSGSNTKSVKAPIIASVVGGVALVLCVLLILYCIYRRQRRRRANSRPMGEIQQYQYGAPSNNLQAHQGVAQPQYPSAVVPEIQTSEPHLYGATYSVPRRSAEGAYMSETNFSNITTHGPRPQSYQTGQTILLGDSSSSGQSPYATRFSQSTEAASPSLGGTVARQSPDNATSGVPYGDRKQRVASPGLPPGAMPSSPGLYEQWIPRTPGSPGSSNLQSFPGLPPRSHTNTALPPYEKTGSIIKD